MLILAKIEMQFLNLWSTGVSATGINHYLHLGLGDAENSLLYERESQRKILYSGGEQILK